MLKKPCSSQRAGSLGLFGVEFFQGICQNRFQPSGDCMLYMVVEHFKGDPAAVYRRFRDQGRLAPEGVRYVDSWVTSGFQRCYQVMECDDPGLLRHWMDRWGDLVDFEVTPVMTSAEAAAIMAPRL